MIIQKSRVVLQRFAKIRIISTSAATVLRLHNAHESDSDHIHYMRLTSVHCFDRDVTASWGHRENQMTHHSLLFTLA